jgi:acyl-CoA thioester hydrolase
VRAVDGYVFHHDVRVRFAETDAQGIAHHASFVVWLEEARVAWLDAFAGGYKGIRERGIEALTTGVHLDYRAATGFHDVIRVWTRCAEIKGARFRYEYVLKRGEETIATGYTTHATVDRGTRRPVRVPPWFLADVVRAEGWEPARTPSSSPRPSS